MFYKHELCSTSSSIISADIPGLTGSGGGKSDENGADEGDTEEDEEEEAMDTKPPTSSPAKTPKKSPIKKPATTKSPSSKSRKSPSKLAGSKRPRQEREKDEREMASPVVKRGKRPMCEYGPKCNKTNREHKEAYDHPWVSVEPWFKIITSLETRFVLSFRNVLGNTSVLVSQSQRYVRTEVYHVFGTLMLQSVCS